MHEKRLLHCNFTFLGEGQNQTLAAITQTA